MRTFGSRFTSAVAALLAAGLSLGCSAKADGPTTVIESTAKGGNPLLVQDNTWPTKAIFTCFRPTQSEETLNNCPTEQAGTQYSDTSAYRQDVEDAFNQTWATYSKVRLVGWGVCNQTQLCDPNTIAITIKTGGCHGLSQIGYYPYSPAKGAWSTLWIDQCSPSTRAAVVAHELGHVLGFEHEDARNDTPAQYAGCASQDYQSGTGTKIGSYDNNSIMEFTYCQNTQLGLTDTDILGVRTFYGPRGEDTVLTRLRDNNIYEKHYSNGWTSWSQISSLSAQYAPAVTITKTGEKDAFAVGTDGHLYTAHNQTGSWGGWNNLGGLVYASPAAITVESSSDLNCSAGEHSCGTKLYLSTFVLGGDAKYWLNYYDPAVGSWVGWSHVSGAADTFVSAPAVTINRNRRTELFARKSDGKIYTSYSDTGLTSWSGWILLPGSGNGSFVYSPAAVTSAEGQDVVFAVKSDGNLYYNYYDPSLGWMGFSSLGGACATSPGAAVSPGGRLTVYCKFNPFDGLWTRFRDFQSTTWGSWVELDAALMASGPGAMQ